MKRAVEVGPAGARKRNRALDPFDPSLKRDASRLLDVPLDESGFIFGRIYMIWSTKPLRVFMIESDYHGCTSRFKVQLMGRAAEACTSHITPNGRICLGLKGVIVERIDPPKSDHLPMKLIYSSGIVIKCMPKEGRGTPTVINSWDDGWFTSEIGTSVESVTAFINAEKNAAEQATAAGQPNKTAQRKARQAAYRQAEEKKQRDLEMRLQAEQGPAAEKLAPDQQNRHATGSESRSTSHTPSDSKRSLSTSPPSSPQARVTAPVGENASSITEGAQGKVQRDQAGRSSAKPTMTAGLRTEYGDKFHAINSLQPSSTLVNVIGVVTSCTAVKTTRNREHMVSLSLVDPSNLDENNAFGCAESGGFKINCFHKKYPEWLPKPIVGDIIIFRKLKVTSWNSSVSAVGYSDKFRWAVYDTKKHAVVPVTLGNAPDQETLNDGFGYVYSPFWTPIDDGLELGYCRQLKEWWDGVQKKAAETEVINIGDWQGRGTTSNNWAGKRTASKTRLHRLLQDASPDAPPSGYFDCTVEILSGFKPDEPGKPYSIYVTDYTPNSNVYSFPSDSSMSQSACPPALQGTQLVLKIEMWDASATLGPTMDTGDVWFLRNVRMKLARNGLFEGTMQEAERSKRLGKSEPEDDDSAEASSPDVHFETLLQRKKAWEEQSGKVVRPVGSEGASTKFDSKLIEDVDWTGGSSFFNCAVEMLHIDLVSPDAPLAFVTDYTYNQALPSFATLPGDNHAVPLDALRRRIVRIHLEGDQVDRGRKWKVGHVYQINNLRAIRRSGIAVERLGGSEMLTLHKGFAGGDASEATDPVIAGLLEQKARWRRDASLEGHNVEGSRKASPTRLTEKVAEESFKATSPPSESSRDISPTRTYSTIREIKASDRCPGQFTTQARVVDYWPLKLLDACVLRCTSCNIDLPSIQRFCSECATDDDVECFYRLAFIIEDEEGERLRLSLCDPSCSLLSDVPATDFTLDKDALNEFRARVQPFIGNLEELHATFDEDLCGKDSVRIKPETPFARMDIQSWLVSHKCVGNDAHTRGDACGCNRAYALLKCELRVV